MPSPSTLAEPLERAQPLTVSVPPVLLKMPPPYSAELLDRVVPPLTVAVPAL
jgi:hypothetical protein